jgi:hypothetical protein
MLLDNKGNLNMWIYWQEVRGTGDEGRGEFLVPIG